MYFYCYTLYMLLSNDTNRSMYKSTVQETIITTLTSALCLRRIISEQDGLFLQRLEVVVPAGRIGQTPLPVFHDVREREPLVLLHSAEKEVLGVEVDDGVQQDLGAVAAKLEGKTKQSVH